MLYVRPGWGFIDRNINGFRIEQRNYLWERGGVSNKDFVRESKGFGMIWGFLIIQTSHLGRQIKKMFFGEGVEVNGHFVLKFNIIYIFFKVYRKG